MSTARRALSLLALAGASALIASGCGGSATPVTDAEYEKAVVTARNRADFALARIPKAADLEQLLERMEEAAVAIDDGAGDLDSVTPPERFSEPGGRLVKALEQLSVDLAATASDLSQPELLANLATGAQGIDFESWNQANAAIADLNELGLRVELIERH